MIITVEHGITIHDDAEASVIQQVEFTAKSEADETLGMVAGKTQIVDMVDHTASNEFSVTGKGPITMVPGLGGDTGISYVNGGQVHIAAIKLTQKLGTGSEWNFTGKHAPHAG